MNNLFSQKLFWALYLLVLLICSFCINRKYHKRSIWGDVIIFSLIKFIIFTIIAHNAFYYVFALCCMASWNVTWTSIHTIKLVSFVLLVTLRSLGQCVLCCVFGTVEKLSVRRECTGFVLWCSNLWWETYEFMSYFGFQKLKKHLYIYFWCGNGIGRTSIKWILN